MNISKFSDIKFELKDNAYYHNLNSDFACFALWKSARQFKEEIKEELSKHFKILLETEIEWSEKNFHKNAERLYEAPIFSENKEFDITSSHAKKIGDTKFILFVLQDKKPKYTYAKSVSGKIELSNLNFVKMKYKFRDWIEREAGFKYGVHSTNNIFEFFFQVPLLLGIDAFKKLLNGQVLSIKKISKDLEGANGWKSYKELFEILNATCNYLVLRGFESLPQSNHEKDLDLLTNNYQKLASAVGARQIKRQPYKGIVTIGDDEISLDMRFVGDNYYFTSWAQKILDTKQYTNGFYTPRIDYYFFSLFYHAKVQKREVKEVYFKILSDIALSLNFDWFDSDVLKNNKESSLLLKGYMDSERYFYEDPIDQGVYENIEVIRHLPTSNVLSIKRPLKNRIKSMLARRLPPKIKEIIKKILYK